jgi:putative alpha-1,2-mannosidase
MGTQKKIKQKLNHLIQQPRKSFQLTPAHQTRRPRICVVFLFVVIDGE